MKLAIVFLTLAMFVANGPSCNSSGNNLNGRAKPQGQALAAGIWGGQHVHADVSERGAEIEFDCAQGSIAQKIVLDGSGRFDVEGSFTTQHAGPVREDANSSRPVRYQGSVSDKEMELTVSDPKTKETIGTFALRFGSEGRLMKCR
jgi:hypothetical protein